MSAAVTLLVIPGLRPETPTHWQPILASEWPGTVSLPALGRANLDLAARIAQIEAAVQAIKGPVVLVAHSAGSVATAHWARQTRLPIHGALLATPPLLMEPLGPDYPALAEFQRNGWAPVPRTPLPFRAIVAASRNDPLGDFNGVCALAKDWGAELSDLGEVGHLNPASGFGPWAGASELIRKLASQASIIQTPAQQRAA